MNGLTSGDALPFPDQDKDAKKVITAVEARPVKREIAVNTPGYRLELGPDVHMTSHQKAKYEVAMTAATILQARLHAQGIDYTRPETANEATVLFLKKEILPVIDVLTNLTTVSEHGELSEEALRVGIDTLKQMFDANVIAESTPLVLPIDTDVAQADVNRTLSTWVHDIRGYVTAPKTAMQLLDMWEAKKARGDITEDDLAVLEERIARTKRMVQTPLLGMDRILLAGMPFIPDNASEQDSGEIFPHKPVSVDVLLSMIGDSVATAGETLNLNREDIQKRLGSSAVDWNENWARRMIDNIISNTQKAYRDLGINDPERQTVTVHMQIDGDNLDIIFGDMGNGYPEEMLKKWQDPLQRANIPTGWSNQAIPTTGIGLKEHAAILEQYYGGKVTLHYSPDGGAATAISLPLVRLKS